MRMLRRRFLWLILPIAAVAVFLLARGARTKLSGQVIPPLCGNSALDAGEECDPPGSSCITGLQCGVSCACACPDGQQRVEQMVYGQAQYESIWPPVRFRTAMSNAGTEYGGVPVLLFQSRDPADNKLKVYLRKQGSAPFLIAEADGDIDMDARGNEYIVLFQDKNACKAVGVAWDVNPVMGAPVEVPRTGNIRCEGSVVLRMLSPTRIVAVWAMEDKRSAPVVGIVGSVGHDAAGAPVITWGPSLTLIDSADVPGVSGPLGRQLDIVVRSETQVTIVGRSPTAVAQQSRWVPRFLAWLFPSPPPLGTSSVWARDCAVGNSIACEDVGDGDLGRAGSDVRAVRLAGGSMLIAPSYSDLPDGGQGAGVLIENAQVDGGWSWTPLPDAGTKEVFTVIPVALNDGRFLVSFLTGTGGSSARHLAVGTIGIDDIAWAELDPAPFNVGQAPPGRPELPLLEAAPAELVFYNLPREGEATTFSIAGGMRPQCALCGNGILEVGEQCDVPGGACAAGLQCEQCRCSPVSSASSSAPSSPPSSSSASSGVPSSSSGGPPTGDMLWIPVDDMQIGAADTAGGSRIYDVVWGNGRFVAGASNGRGSWSDDGASWNASGNMNLGPAGDRGGSGMVLSLAFGNGRFVAGGWAGRGSTSTDGETWTAIEDMQFGGGNVDSIAYGNGRFVAIGYYGSVSVSLDGITWTAVDPGGQFRASRIIAVDFARDRFFAVGEQGKAFSSPDGLAWTAIPNMTFGGQTIWSVAEGSGTFVAVGSGRRGAYSADGVAWTAVPDIGFGQGMTGSAMPVFDIAFGDGRFVAVGTQGKGATSVDGVTWTAVEDMEVGLNAIIGVTWGDGTFIAAGDGLRASYSIAFEIDSSSSSSSSSSVSSMQWQTCSAGFFCPVTRMGGSCIRIGWEPPQGCPRVEYGGDCGDTDCQGTCVRCAYSSSSDTSPSSAASSTSMFSSAASSTQSSIFPSSSPSSDAFSSSIGSSVPSSSSAGTTLCGNFTLDAGEECEVGLACPEDLSCDIRTCACEAGEDSSDGYVPVCGNNRLEPGEDCEAGVDLPESSCKGSAQCNLQQCRCPPGQSRYKRRGRR